MFQFVKAAVCLRAVFNRSLDTSDSRETEASVVDPMLKIDP